MLDKLREAKDLAEVEPDKALFLCNEILNEHIDDVHAQQALFISAYIMMKAEKFGLAYNIYKRCSELRPNQSEIYCNMGMCVEDARPKEAVKLFQRAQRLDPNNPKAFANEGLIALQEASPRRSIYLSDKALRMNPDLMSARQNRALAKLMLRNWRGGWKDFFDTIGTESRPMRDYGCEEWTPESEAGSIVLYGEQGVGDEIMYASCIPDLIADGFYVIIDCDSRLEEAFKRAFPACRVYGDRFKDESRVLDNHTPRYQCSIGQLPAKYRLKESDFTGEPYLKASTRERIIPNDKLNIGIAWSGGNLNTGQKKRTLSPDDFAELFKIDANFVSLEYKPVSDNIVNKYKLFCYPEWTGKGQDIQKLVNLVSELDVVITACTTVVYIAGALGVPCHVLVPEKAGYRYHLEGGFPWYKSVTLHRDKGDWKETIRNAAITAGVL